MVTSPLTGNQAFFVKEIPKKNLIEAFKKSLDLDVSYLLDEASTIELYRCQDTGYRFFFPFNIAGDDNFYQHLQEKGKYYMPWKWEHQQTATLISSGMKILEVGCAKGSFLNKIKNDFDVEVAGLELNEKAAFEAKSSGLNVLTETIQKHAINHRDEYDLVCSFQVVEHISDIRSFIQAKVDTLKVGGKLIICVPNNDSFIKHEEGGILNYPPHHMGWWNEESLRSLTNYFNIELNNFLFEPLQEYHRGWYRDTWVRKNLKYRVFVSAFFRLRIVDFFDFLIKNRVKKIHGHTVSAVYTKR